MSLGILTNAAAVRKNFLTNAFTIGLPPPLVGSIVGIATMPMLGLTTTTVLVWATMTFVGTLGVGVGLHRHFSHRSYRCAPWGLQLALLGTWAIQGPIQRWVADHRRHHRLSDKPFDLHSQLWRGREPLSGWRGLMHAHIGWMFTGNPSSELRYAPDTKNDQLVIWFTRNYWIMASTGLMVPAVLGWFLGSEIEPLRCLL